jgi:peptide/nickel transport system permease protein
VARTDVPDPQSPGAPVASNPYVRFLARRITLAAALVLVVSVIVFVITNVLPGDPARLILGRDANPAAVALLRHQLGVDHSLADRYWRWLSGLAHAQLGDSYGSRQPVSSLLHGRAINTLVLASCASVFMIPIGLMVGAVAALRPGHVFDHLISGATLSFVAIPEFISGSLLVLVFAVILHLLPAVSVVPPGTNPLSQPSILVLPVLTLSLTGIAFLARMMRAGVLDVLQSEYIQMARINGFRERRVLAKHVVRNSLAPSIAVIAVTLQWLLGGVAIVETVFNYQGLGALLVQSVLSRDLPVVQALAIIVATIYITINVFADLAVILLVPKLRTAL